jgi:pimeloyl-ACP methyl ester carboxylesterase
VSGYVDLPGQRVFVEEYGSGDPVYLLHGGFTDTGGWAGQVPALAERHHVIVPGRRGHGRSPDVPGPCTTQVMAEETAALIRTLGHGPARRSAAPAAGGHPDDPGLPRRSAAGALGSLRDP